jgi:hypothetical protein
LDESKWGRAPGLLGPNIPTMANIVSLPFKISGLTTGD